MVTLSLGTKKRTFKSIREAAEVTGIKYITLYQRLRIGMSASSAIKKPVRKYVKKVVN
jgi:pyruvate/2-oxoacid:ferredoxin oxidoreductase beta subunit